MFALIVLGGCATTEPANLGVVESIASDPEHPAPGGGIGSSTKLIAVRMADNTLHYFGTRAVDLRIGERVGITPDGQMLRRPRS